MTALPLHGVDAFLAVAEHGSLRRAAGALGVRPPAVSYQIKALEQRIGTALFVRTTRSVHLTDAGRALLARAKPAMAELAEALEHARRSAGATTGTIRLTLPDVAYELTIAKKLAAFQRRFPDITLELSFNDAFVDVAAEGFHAGVRLGDHIREDMIAVRLSPPMRQVVFASPGYFARHGRPERPRDLLRHPCIRYRFIASKRFAEWQFDGPDGLTTVEVSGTLIVDSTNALIAASRAGLGIGWLFRPAVAADLAAGRLESVLDSYAVERPGYFLYYPQANAQIEVLRQFVDFMRDRPSTS
jgi:DNA-binding transcriptional LysR family regulator